MPEHAPDLETSVRETPEPTRDAPPTRGDQALQRLLAHGRPQPREVALVVAQFPGDRSAIFTMLQRTLGNAFVQQVLASTAGSERAEEIDASEPSNLGRLREESEVSADTERKKGQPACERGSSTDAAVAALVNLKPTDARGPKGHAAWLVEAQRLCFVNVPNIMTYEQLLDLVEGRPVRTYEFNKDRKVSDKDIAARKQVTNGKLDNAHRLPGTQQYDIDLTALPILETLVAVARTRIREWQKVGGPKPTVLSLASFVRADMWFNPSSADPSPHEPGTAIDLGFVGTANSAGDVFELLKDLPPSGSIEVFRDTNSSLHLDRRPSGYGLGIPAAGDFIPGDMAIDPDTRRCPAQDKAEATADPSKGTIEVRGVEMFRGVVSRAQATWSAGKWQWGPWTQTGESILDRLRNQKLKPAIQAFGKRP